MIKLRSNWYVAGFNDCYPSLAAAKAAIRDYFSPSERKRFLKYQFIYHDVGNETVSCVPIEVDDNGRVTFGRPRKL